MVNSTSLEVRLIDYLQKQDLDLKTALLRYEGTGISPRFMDQKVTPDVLKLVASCVVDYLHLGSKDFTAKDIMAIPKLNNQITRFFSKPNVDEPTAQHEYDKFVAQPLKALAYAGVLTETRMGTQIRYSVIEQWILEEIARSDENSFTYLYVYLSELLTQSGMMRYFEIYRDSAHTEEDYVDLKVEFISDIQSYTNIEKDLEARRILPKVLNVLAVAWVIPGSVRGHVGKTDYMFADLAYNSRNFRDRNKDKKQTRQQAGENGISRKPNTSNMTKVMKDVRERHAPDSEVRDAFARGKATQVHHIFPKSRFPQIADYRENLILLTPDQHYTRAHPSNRTASVDLMYQIDCLLAKLRSIENDIDGFYNLDRFIEVINTGYELSIPNGSSSEYVRQILARKRIS